MHPLYIASVVLSLFAFCTIGLHIFWTCDKGMRKWLLLLIIMELPLNALAFHFIRIPYHVWLKALLQNDTLFSWILSFSAPLTEEPAKLLPFVFPFFWPKVNQNTLCHVVLSVGLGFGVGEAWNIAYLLVNSSPALAKLPWYSFGGFWQERMMVCIIHAGMSCVAIWWFLNRKPFWLGYVIAMAIHFVGNFPIILLSPLGLNTPAWFTGLFIQIWTLAALVVLVWLILKLTAPRSYECYKIIEGEAECPNCKQVYQRPLLLAANFGPWRYERCSKCGKWNWMKSIQTGKKSETAP